MKKIFLPVIAAFILSSCGGGEAEPQDASTNTNSGVSEEFLVNGFDSLQAKFDVIFNNANDYSQDDLVPLRDSMEVYVDALIEKFPNSENLPKIVSAAGRSALNSRNGELAEKYFNYVVKTYPNDSILVPKAMYFIGLNREVVLQDLEGAKKAYKELYRSYPRTQWADNAKSSIKQINDPHLFDIMSADDKDSTETK